MIEVKLSFPDTAAMLAYFSARDTQPSATITPEKQEAARQSTGKADKPTKVVKNPETPVEALVQAVEKTEDAKPARTYETSGLAQKIAKGAAKDKDATVALLVKHKAINAEGKPNGKALPVEAFDAFEADIDALLSAEVALG
jgi:hypothetical protein